MRFRLKAFGLHLSSSICVLSIILGGLYLGWYYWPGWYLVAASRIVLTMILVDVALGPLITLIIASPAKPKRELARDIAMIVTVQLIALSYGTLTLWHGRPLYYALSVDSVKLVQASDIGARERSVAHKVNPQFAPAWHDRPRWVWAPLPDDPKELKAITKSVMAGGDDVIDMPRYFKPWAQSEKQLREHLKSVSQLPYFSPRQREELVGKVKALALPSEDADALIIAGRERPVVAIFDPRTLKLRAILAAD